MEQPMGLEEKRAAKKRAAEKRAAEAAARRQLRREESDAWPGEETAAKMESSGPRQRWLCIAMFGSSAVIALMLGLRLLFYLQPEYTTEIDNALEVELGTADRRRALGDAPEEPSGCGGMCGHVLCTGAVGPGGAPAALREFFNRSWYLATCLSSPEGAQGVRLVIRESLLSDYGSGGGGELRGGWLDPRLRVSDLTLSDCGLRALADGAFLSPAFARTHALDLEGNALRVLGPGAFAGLGALKILLIRRNEGLKFISPVALLPVASSLRILTVQNALAHPQFITNLTGTVTLPLVEHVNFDHNNITTLEPFSFLGLTSIESISVVHSGLRTLGDGVFDSVSNSVELIRLEGNELETLTEKTFAPILNSTHQIKLRLSNNPWNCSCSFSWIQNYSALWKIDNADLTPKCANPPHNKNRLLHEAQFCPDKEYVDSKEQESEEDVNVSTPDALSRNWPLYLPPTVPTSTTIEPNEIQIHCEDSSDEQIRTIVVHKDIPASIHFKEDGTSVSVPIRNRTFTITRIGANSMDISLPKSDEEEILYWHPQNIASSAGTSDVGCHTAVNDSVTVGNLTPLQVYVVCLVNATRPARASGLQCVSVQTATEAGSTEAGAYKVPLSPSAAAARGNRAMLFAICVLTLMLAALTVYVAYSFLCRKRSDEEERAAWREPNWPSVEWPGAKDQEPRGIFWIAGRRRESVIDSV